MLPQAIVLDFSDYSGEATNAIPIQCHKFSGDVRIQLILIQRLLRISLKNIQERRIQHASSKYRFNFGAIHVDSPQFARPALSEQFREATRIPENEQTSCTPTLWLAGEIQQGQWQASQRRNPEQV